ncbi:hypothetical protein P153DRAFT_8017 [Dothidotthia symphoricarpi CBS 119687]|uniref:Uncharacterized protein n=1 Tax=Dothidotthia symphoricarpi CBS 119687 TaxID=1392245 RepID=A0A6A6AW10_9PLEO|nr:uncharacterized protein P153DRAFT_8017 [Dothidotthia symphoricarpi CBS 119687]KAF2134711.1 hypothetical protein P153DRAFT_8017 [Dothidotthia symphoricarpi CBS 119687]
MESKYSQSGQAAANRLCYIHRGAWGPVRVPLSPRYLMVDQALACATSWECPIPGCRTHLGHALTLGLYIVSAAQCAVDPHYSWLHQERGRRVVHERWGRKCSMQPRQAKGSRPCRSTNLGSQVPPTAERLSILRLPLNISCCALVRLHFIKGWGCPRLFHRLPRSLCLAAAAADYHAFRFMTSTAVECSTTS